MPQTHFFISALASCIGVVVSGAFQKYAVIPIDKIDWRFRSVCSTTPHTTDSAARNRSIHVMSWIVALPNAYFEW